MTHDILSPFLLKAEGYEVSRDDGDEATMEYSDDSNLPDTEHESVDTYLKKLFLAWLSKHKGDLPEVAPPPPVELSDELLEKYTQMYKEEREFIIRQLEANRDVDVFDLFAYGATQTQQPGSGLEVSNLLMSYSPADLDRGNAMMLLCESIMHQLSNLDVAFFMGDLIHLGATFNLRACRSTLVARMVERKYGYKVFTCSLTPSLPHHHLHVCANVNGDRRRSLGQILAEKLEGRKLTWVYGDYRQFLPTWNTRVLQEKFFHSSLTSLASEGVMEFPGINTNLLKKKGISPCILLPNNIYVLRQLLRFETEIKKYYYLSFVERMTPNPSPLLVRLWN